ncbi:MAG: tetratricopeptide repeat protein [Gemmataceae bacterium]|nr:tetratricopeptide repeat protein [Gemmataceae bacterium]
MDLDATLLQLSREPDLPLDVAQIALELAKDEFPHLDVAGYVAELDAMAKEAARWVSGSFEDQVRGLCRYLFHDLGFHGNIKEYYDPRNSYFNTVLDRRTGIPITLSAVTMAVGRRVGLCIEGVGLPGHFIVKAVADRSLKAAATSDPDVAANDPDVAAGLSLRGTEEIFIDPFHGGRFLTQTDCENLVQQSTGVPFEATSLSLWSIPLGLMIQRMLRNLKSIYWNDEDYPRAIRVMQRLFQITPEDAALRRDLGVGLLRLRQPGKAVDHLRYYVEQAAEAEDVEEIRGLLRDADHKLAEWN